MSGLSFYSFQSLTQPLAYPYILWLWCALLNIPLYTPPSVVRSGDYYLFETDSEEEEEDEEKKDDDSPKKSAFQVQSKPRALITV